MCNSSKMMKAKLQGLKVSVNHVQNEIIMNFNSFAVNNTHWGGYVMIPDHEAPVSLARRPWLDQYLKMFYLTIKDMVSSSCYQGACECEDG